MFTTRRPVKNRANGFKRTSPLSDYGSRTFHNGGEDLDDGFIANTIGAFDNRLLCHGPPIYCSLSTFFVSSILSVLVLSWMGRPFTEYFTRYTFPRLYSMSMLVLLW